MTSAPAAPQCPSSASHPHLSSGSGHVAAPGRLLDGGGYAAAFSPNPTYEKACSGRAGHTEAVLVVYDPAKISAVDLLRWHW